MNRRRALNSAAVAIASSGLLFTRTSLATAQGVAGGDRDHKSGVPPFIATGDGARLFYQDWGTGKCPFFPAQHLPEF